MTAILCWGLAYVPSAWLAQDVGPFGAAAWRLGVGGAALFGVMAVRGQPLSPGVPILTVIWLGLVQTAVFYGATFWGIVHGGAGLASVLANSDPLWVAVLALIFLGERLASTQRVGLIIGFIGVGIAACSGGLWPPHPTAAAAIVVIGAVCWSIGTIVAAGAIRKDSHPVSLAAWQMTIGALVLAALSPIDGHHLLPQSIREVGLILFLGVVGSAVPTALFYVALRTGVASEISAWFFVVPIIGVASAWPLLGETPTWSLGIGLVGVSAGLWFVLRQRQRLVASDTPMSTVQPPEFP
jgi:drug/metabolite transporter (DMT)-like permease